MSKHSSLGASSSHRWMACPGSVQLSKGRPNKGSVFADEGTAAHELGARCLSNNNLDPVVFLDTIIQTDDMQTAVKVTEEMVEAVQVYVSYVRSRQTDDGYTLVGIEEQFDLAPLNPPAPMWGRADTVLFLERQATKTRPGMVYLPKGSVLEVVDLKYGAGTVVNVEGNTQGLYYAIGACLATQRKADKVRITIVQPRAPHRDGIVRSYEITWDELVAFREELLSGAVATQQDNAPLAAGDHCKFCPALAVCPAQAELAQAAAKATFSSLLPDVYEQPGIGGDDIYPPAKQLPTPTALSLSDLQEIVETAPMITDWLKAVMQELRDMTERGEDTGYKLVAKRGRRKWKNEAAAEQVLRDAGGHDAAFTSKLRSVTQAEAYLKEHVKIVGVPEELWAMVSSGTNLVPNSDPREAVAALPSAQEVFSTIEVSGAAAEAPEALEEAQGVHAEDVLLVTDEASAVVVEVGFEDGSRELREVSEARVKILETTDPDFEPVEVTEPIEPELVEYSVDAAEYKPNEIEVQLWRVQIPNAEDFYVEAGSKTDAKEAAREELGISRLPNHTEVSPS